MTYKLELQIFSVPVALSLFPFLAENWQNVAVTVLLVAAIGTGEEASHHHDTGQPK